MMHCNTNWIKKITMPLPAATDTIYMADGGSETIFSAEKNGYYKIFLISDFTNFYGICRQIAQRKRKGKMVI